MDRLDRSYQHCSGLASSSARPSFSSLLKFPTPLLKRTDKRTNGDGLRGTAAHAYASGHRRSASDSEATMLANRIRRNLWELSNAINSQLDRNIGFDSEYAMLEVDGNSELLLLPYQRGAKSNLHLSSSATFECST